MRFSEMYQKGRPVFSFEFFPPKTKEGEEKLLETLKDLKPLKPDFVSVTYGAMGTTRDRTIRMVHEIKQAIGLEVAAHLTCVGHSRAEIEDILERLEQGGIENIVALRGDVPQGQSSFEPHPDGFRYAGELVAFIKHRPNKENQFSIAVAGYPEGHRECPSLEEDIEHLKWKVDQGADIVITQLFFCNEDYFRFVELAKHRGIQVPIVPGIMPVTNARQIQKFSEMCGAKIPLAMQEALSRFGSDPVACEAYGIEYATRQCEELLRCGVPGIHFYTLNKSKATRQIYINLGLKPGEN